MTTTYDRYITLNADDRSMIRRIINQYDTPYDQIKAFNVAVGACYRTRDDAEKKMLAKSMMIEC